MILLRNKNKILKEQIIEISGVDIKKCMQCGKCSGTCPAYESMEYHPNEFVYMVNDEDVESLIKSNAIYKCVSCFACVDRCPRGVEPAKIIEAIRLLAIRQKGQNYMTADDIPDLTDENIPQQAIVGAMRQYFK